MFKLREVFSSFGPPSHSGPYHSAMYDFYLDPNPILLLALTVVVLVLRTYALYQSKMLFAVLCFLCVVCFVQNFERISIDKGISIRYLRSR